MPFPFGGHPTLGQYMVWAMKQGCEVQTGVRSGPDGKPISMIRMVSKAGWVSISDMPQSEFLVPTFIAYLDRRLGHSSPWFSIDPENPAYV